MRRLAVGCPVTVLLASLAGCGSSAAPKDEVEPPPVYAEHDVHPEAPAVLRDVALIDDEVRFTQPFVPGHRTTMDGRVALRVQGGPPGTRRLAENLSFYLMVPERLDEPIMSGPPGSVILSDDEGIDVPFPPALDPSVGRLGHHAICDPTGEFPVPGERPNPHTCGADGKNDCYQFTIINSTSPQLGAQLWGTPVTVEVTAPKTRDARIVRVELGEPVAGMEIPFTGEWTEPAVTMDGRLLTGRLGRAPRDWTNPNTGVEMSRPWDLAYAVLPESATPCDVTGWTKFHPMSHAPYDPEMIGRYGLAAYPFRDAEGEPIADGEDLGGTYPWVDREGANVFMAAVPGRIVEQSEARYPRRCVTPGCEDYEEAVDWDRGFMVAGLWTHGKFVHLDGMINNMDWAVGVTPAAHFMVEMYRNAGTPVEVRFGSGRFIDSVRNAGGPYPPGFTHNANILDSLQNVLNHREAVRPVTPRDVVWLMSTGVATDEIAFDDLLDPNALIVSNMQASITPLYYEGGVSSSFPKHWNGQVRSVRVPLPLPELYVLEPEEDAEIHLQNAATSLAWSVPKYGAVAAATGRVEPIALGGVTGKGFWLSGANEVRYAIPAQPRSIADVDWYFGIFLDARSGEDESRVLATFPDGTAIRVVGVRAVHYVRGGRVVRRITLPERDGWVHLAWSLRDANREVTFLHDGFALDRYRSRTPLFQLQEGDLVIGQATQDEAGYRGVRGWIDELKVFAYAPNPEVACNHAHGTLGRVEGGTELALRAELYPDWAHDEVAAAAGVTSGDGFICHADHSRDYAAHSGNVPDGVVSVRDAITFPEGPVRAGAPRPDSSQNAFCLTCHHEAGRGGLSLAALSLDPGTLAEHDRRRQPLQPPRRVFGNVPAGWILPGTGPGGPSTAMQAPAEGLLIDEWVLPSAGR